MNKYQELALAVEKLTPVEKEFLDLVYINGKTFNQAAEFLCITRQEVSALDKRVEAVRKQLTPIRNKWCTKKIETSFWEFLEWVFKAEQKCKYCEVTEEQLSVLHTKGIINKRTTRGKTLELDRIISSESYSNIENLTYCCYWCNNAKTDTFNEQEGKLIGEAIKKIWEQRLAHDN